MIVPVSHLVMVSAILFGLGLACVLARRSLIMILIGTEIMLNAAALLLVGGSARWQAVDGQIFALLLIALASAEVAIALALVVALRRRSGTTLADAFERMRG